MAKKKLGRAFKYDEPTMVSSIRHPKSKKKEVKKVLIELKKSFDAKL